MQSIPPSKFSVVVLATLLACCYLVSFSSCQQGKNTRPVIGVLAQPYNGATSKERHSYIAASYVKFIEGAGARVVPIPYDLPKEQLLSLFKQLNGVLFPGGGADLNQTHYFYTQQYLLDLAMTQDVFFPVWATCLGFEALVIAAAGSYSILHTGFDSWNISMPLNFHPDPQSVRAHSKMFNKDNMPSEEMFNSFAKEAITLNNHHSGVLVRDWFANTRLNQIFRVLSTNKDRKGQEFISTIEAVNFPVYSTQWHPEKVSYEWRADEDINHSYTSLLANQHMANFFVNECRKNDHKFADESELANKWLIYNFTPEYTFKQEPDFVQTYFFPKSSQ